MTIKRNGDLVVLKNGKVSCSCCECCMYPAAALVDDLYSYEDLPDAIDVGGIEYTKLDPPESVAGFTRYYINSNSEYLGILEGEDEDSTWTYEGGGGPCLINGFNGEGGEREDQFADTYTVAYVIGDDNIGSTTITRQSLCVWTGNAGGVSIRLEYESADFFRWFMITPETEIAKAEPSFENTPTGFYQTGNIEFTVS